jgi:hypothetical protein
VQVARRPSRCVVRAPRKLVIPREATPPLFEAMDMSEQAEDRKACFEIGNEPGIRPGQARLRTLFQPCPKCGGSGKAPQQGSSRGQDLTRSGAGPKPRRPDPKSVDIKPHGPCLAREMHCLEHPRCGLSSLTWTVASTCGGHFFGVEAALRTPSIPFALVHVNECAISHRTMAGEAVLVGAASHSSPRRQARHAS